MATESSLREKRNIIILGETGSGKSSLINMIVGKDVATTSDKATGCTFNSAEYCDDKGNCFFDTVGLNESGKGTVTAKDAIKQLATLFKSLESGVNLVIFVIRKGRITETMVKNYTIFVQGICGGKVPVLLAISGCEMDTDTHVWFTENKEYFDKNNMFFDTVVSGCFTNKLDAVKPSMHPVMLEAYDETAKQMSGALYGDRYAESHKFGSWRSWLKTVLATIWNTLAKFYQWPQISLWDDLKQAFMNTMGLSATDATALANDLASNVE